VQLHFSEKQRRLNQALPKPTSFRLDEREMLQSQELRWMQATEAAWSTSVSGS